jgi:hypothetical protein
MKFYEFEELLVYNNIKIKGFEKLYEKIKELNRPKVVFMINRNGDFLLNWRPSFTLSNVHVN